MVNWELPHQNWELPDGKNNHKTFLHNLRYILESELGVEREKIEESGVINAKDSGDSALGKVWHSI